MKIELTQGYFAIINKEDFELISKFKWCVCIKESRRYVVTDNKGKRIYMHRLILNAKTTEIVDHINGNCLDNRKENLRICTTMENTRNRKKSNKNKSGYKGVSWHKAAKKWEAHITVNYKKIYLGCYQNKIHAAKVYNEAAIKYFGKYARLNEV